MGRAHTEPNLVPDKLAMGISLLFPQNIVISEPIPRWKRKREVWSITQPKEPGTIPALPSPSPLLLGVHPWSIPKSHPFRDFPKEKLN